MENSINTPLSNDTIAIERRIFLLREQRILLSTHLAELYEVQHKVLMQAVRRNRKRFPEDFMFQLSDEEFKALKSQFVTSSWGGLRKKTFRFYRTGSSHALFRIA